MNNELNFENEYNAWLDSLPASQPEPKPIVALIPDVPAAIADQYDSALDFAQDVERYWSIDECLQYPCFTTLDRALYLARRYTFDDFEPFYADFMEICKDALLRRKADYMLSERKPVYRPVRY